MPKGRKAIPTKLKEKSPRRVAKSRVNAAEPTPQVGRMIPPSILNEDEVRVFLEISSVLRSQNLETNDHRMMLALVAQLWVEVEVIRKELPKWGRFYKKKNGDQAVTPAYKALSEARARLQSALGEFGQSPASATRVKTHGGAEAGESGEGATDPAEGRFAGIGKAGRAGQRASN